ncbi:zinc-binding dehydrogenase [Mycobacterium sp. 48b]|uniref:zinc-binding dehydrogenase n=1 Tax=Mycobacterium sp. 48b TaxID=3400426 RepID=UPI003AAAA85C
MKALVARGGLLGVEEVASPTPGPGQVLIKPLATGVCGSDVHLLHTQASMADVFPPIVLGHEFVGEIVEYGAETERRLKPGTLVTTVPYLDHASGPQHIGVSPLAPGALAERMLAQESRLVAVPAGLPVNHAALAEPLAVGTHAVRIAHMQPGDVPLVVGCGPVGLAVIAALRAAGHRPIVATDFSEPRRKLAEALGADNVVNPAAASPYVTWAALAGSELPNSCLLVEDPEPTTVVFECVGLPGVLDTIVNSVPGHTRVVVVGACQQPDEFTPAIAIMKELTLTFSYGYRPHEFEQSLQAVADGCFDAERLITATRSLDQASSAFEELSGPSQHCKIVINPNS